MAAPPDTTTEGQAKRQDSVVSHHAYHRGNTMNFDETYGTMEAPLSAREKEMSLEDGITGTYDINQLVTLSVFGFYKGTVFQSRILWLETAVNAAIYWSVFLALYCVRWKGFSEFFGKESTIRAFIAMFSTLIGLLLSFYTALNLGRWWQMRLATQHLVEGSKKLTMYVAHGCSSDPVPLQTINRYARASMYLVFSTSRQEEGGKEPVDMAVKMGLLTDEEGDKLKDMGPHPKSQHRPWIHAETLWVWLANLVTRLHNQGYTKGPPHYCALLGAVEEGRGGVATIQSFLETPIPLGYVHLLCLMVKLHNFILSILMAMASVMLAAGAEGFQPVGVFRTAFRAFFMPFLYNAILILNAQVTDPFGADQVDFDWGNYDLNLHMSNQSYITSMDNLPDCIAQWKGPEKPKA